MPVASAARRLTPDDWVNAALATIAHGGVDAVAVETVAASLGATKGSFYWHFKNRDALIDAALAKWEQRRTEEVIRELEREPDAAERLRMILRAAFESGPSDRTEIALLANPSHPSALRAVRRVAERRMAYIADQLQLLGWSRAEALDRALLLYYVYVGHMQTAHVAPRVVSADAKRRHPDLVFDALASLAAPTAHTRQDEGVGFPAGS
jgi:AcrR family transcriptional regulator